MKGKNYLDEKLEYEGYYLYNKKYDGKGYDKNGNIIYELIKGTGKVKEYDYISKRLEFDGEYLNGEKNGYGKEYGLQEFEGEYLNGKKWNGKECDRSLYFEPHEYEYIDGKRIRRK